MSNHLKSIHPLTIETIRAWEFCGNAHSDAAAFVSIDAFAANAANTDSDRAESLRVMVIKGMGFEPHLAGPDDDAALIAEFMAERE